MYINTTVDTLPPRKVNSPSARETQRHKTCILSSFRLPHSEASDIHQSSNCIRRERQIIVEILLFPFQQTAMTDYILTFVL